MANEKDFADAFKEFIREDARKTLKLDQRTPGQIFDLVQRLVDLLQVEKMTAQAEAWAKSGSVIERVKAKQLGILLFAQQAMEACPLDLNPAERAALALEVLEQMTKAQPPTATPF